MKMNNFFLGFIGGFSLLSAGYSIITVDTISNDKILGIQVALYLIAAAICFHS